MYQNRLTQEAPGLSGRIPFVQHTTRPKNNNSFDSMLLMILACFGIIGFSYVFYCFVNPDMGPNPTNFSFIHAASPLGMSDQDSTNSDLEISGPYETLQPMTFTLNSYNPEISYILDFGNGEELILKDAKCQYTYKNKGSYQLKMKALFNKKEQIICSKTLNIQKAGIENDRTRSTNSSI
jgi:hypothetical protein